MKTPNELTREILLFEMLRHILRGNGIATDEDKKMDRKVTDYLNTLKKDYDYT